jgi:serine/tyrosine/threonine adenylyltransferase
MRRVTARLQHLLLHNQHVSRPPLSRTMSTSTNGTSQFQGVTLDALPKSHVFTANLPPDPLIPSPQASKDAPNQRLRVSRPVKSALFTWVAPEKTENPQLLATSPTALRDLGLDVGQAETEDFRNLVSGNRIYDEHYPWGTKVVEGCS